MSVCISLKICWHKQYAYFDEIIFQNERQLCIALLNKIPLFKLLENIDKYIALKKNGNYEYLNPKTCRETKEGFSTATGGKV